MMWNKTSALLLFLLPLAANAQYKDAGLWASFSASAELTKQWEIAVSPEMRFDENGTRLASAFTDIGAQYKVNKFFFVTATYRAGARRSDEFYDTRQRAQLGLGFKRKWKDFSVTYQPRWQLAIAGFAAESDADFVTTLRNKLKVQYSGWKKTDLSSSFEVFNANSAFGAFTLQNWRWIAEIERSINKRNAVSIGYLIQKNLLDTPNEMDFVFLLSYQLKLDLKKEKKNKEEELPK